MQVKAESVDRRLRLRLYGELDHHAARQLMKSIADELEYALPLEVVLDFSGVTFMDSSGIAVALHTLQQVKRLGGKCGLQIHRNRQKGVFCSRDPKNDRNGGCI